MFQTLFARYTVALPEMWAAGLPFDGYGEWLTGTAVGAMVVLAMTMALGVLQKKDKVGKVVASWVTSLINSLWAAIVLDGLAPILIPAAVGYGIFLGVRTLWRSRQPTRPTPARTHPR